MTEIQLTGSGRLGRQLQGQGRAWDAAPGDGAARAMEAEAEQIRTDLRGSSSVLPRRTGALRRSVRVEASQSRVIAYANSYVAYPRGGALRVRRFARETVLPRVRARIAKEIADG